MTARIAMGAAVVVLFSAAGVSGEVSLDGRWALHRSASPDRPGAGAEWTAVTVPSYLDQSDGRPYLWYRRTFRRPATGGRFLFLRFGGAKFVTDVYVNARRAGGHVGGWEPFEVDITGACSLDGENELLVRVRDVTGMIDPPAKPDPVARGARFLDRVKDAVMAPVGSQYTRVGLWQPVSLAARDEVFVEDVFVRTSVRHKRIDADVTVRNLATAARQVTVAASVAGERLRLGPGAAAVPAGKTATVTLSAPWAAPRLWRPGDPHLYRLTVTARSAGVVAERPVRFGFREFTVDGEHLLLNGVRMNFLATAGHPRGDLAGEQSKAAAVRFYKRIRAAGCVAMRLHANVWPEWWYEAADEVGMPIIMESALFCNSQQYALTKPQFWANYREHLRAICLRGRNHPSVVMYSLENEILHCGGDRVAGCEARLAEAGRLLKGLDPTRPIMYDADGDPGGVADVVNIHYPLDFNLRNLWPDAGRWIESGMKTAAYPHVFWKWDRRKPLYLGEFLHIQHYTSADPYSVLLGDGAYVGHDLAMARAKAAAWEMQVEAYRAAGVTGLCPWTLTEIGPTPDADNRRYLAVKRVYQKNAAFIREYDTRFFAAQTVGRTVDVYNDTPTAAELTLTWRLDRGGKDIDSGGKSVSLAPAGRKTLRIDLAMPDVADRTALRLRLGVTRGGRSVFSESKRYWVFPRRKLPVPPGVRIALFEGEDSSVSKALGGAGARFARVADLAKLPQGDVLIIGPHALDRLRIEGGELVVGLRSGAAAAVGRFVRRGGGVLVLEQHSIPDALLPARLVDRGCTIAFQRSRDQSLFAGIEEGDFSFWRGDHVVARKTIARPSGGRFRVLVDSGGPEGLAYLPLCEVLEGAGRYLMSQLAIGEKLDSEPVAGLMLGNLIARAAARPAPTAALAVVQDKLNLTGPLGEIGAVFTDVSGRLERGLDGAGVLLAEADCDEVARRAETIRAFAARGGRVILHAATPRGIERLGAVFGEPIGAQRSTSIPVNIARWDAVIDGLSNQDLYWYAPRGDLSWRVRTPTSAAVCDHVIVGRLPKAGDCTLYEAERMAVAAGKPSAQADHSYMYSTAAIKATVNFARTGEYALIVRGRGTPVAGVYPQIAISIDGRRAGSVTVAGEKWGTYVLTARVEAGRREVRLAFVNDAYAPERNEDRNVAVDSLAVGPAGELKSTRLLRPAALVKTPVGRGFVLLDQVRWDRSDIETAKAARFLSNLLTNLGCDFAPQGGGVTIAGDKLKAKGKLSLYSQSGGVAYLATNGTICAKVRFAATRRYVFAVKASGTQAGGEYPNIAVSIDGKVAGNLKLTGPGWHTLRISADVTEGTHEVALAFTNDFYDPPDDRNLRIANLTIR